MSYRVEQKVKGKIYLYEVESYWDKDKQQSRQKRTYLGRKDEETGEIVDTKKCSKPKNSYRFGSVYLLKKISGELGLSKLLSDIFPDNFEEYLALAFYKIIESAPYYLYDLWQEENHIFAKSKLSSQRISEVLLSLGQDEKGIERFFNDWITLNNEDSSVMFDITSISSYSKNNELLEFGYNRDKEDLEQINLGLISKEKGINAIHLPLAYRIYSGSISDVVTLKNVLELIVQYELDLSCLIMDKGFYSQENIQAMSKRSLKFLCPLTFATELALELEQEVNSSLNAFSFNSKIYSHTKKRININGVTCTAHVYLDKERCAREESQLIRKISELEEAFDEKKFKSEDRARLYIEETLKSKKKFFTVRKKNGKFYITRNKKVIENEVLLKGKLILITNQHKLDKLAVLTLYRNKDGVEKVFQAFKHQVNEKRSRTKSSLTMKGSIFINFLALILISHIDQVMTENKLYQKFSKKEVFKTLDKLKVFELANEQILLGEVSKKQKTIFNAFKIMNNIKPSYNLTGF